VVVFLLSNMYNQIQYDNNLTNEYINLVNKYQNLNSTFIIFENNFNNYINNFYNKYNNFTVEYNNFQNNITEFNLNNKLLFNLLSYYNNSGYFCLALSTSITTGYVNCLDLTYISIYTCIPSICNSCCQQLCGDVYVCIDNTIKILSCEIIQNYTDSIGFFYETTIINNDKSYIFGIPLLYINK